MKSSYMQTVKDVISQMRMISSNKITIQRVANAQSGNRYVQILTTIGVVTVRDTGALTEPDYPIQDIGDPKDWSKVSKGVIVSKSTIDTPFTTAQNAAFLGDSEIAAAEMLLDATTGLAPAQTIAHPGMQVVYALDSGVTVWSYDPAGGTALTNHVGQWTRNAEPITGIYALIRPWVKSVLYSLPKDPETGLPNKVSGVSFGSIGTRVGVHIVCKDLNMVIACTGAFCPKEQPGSYTLDGRLHLYRLLVDNTFMKQEDEQVKANLIDMSALQQQPANSTPKSVEESKPAPETTQPSPEPAPVEQEKPVAEVVENNKAVETAESVSEPVAPETEVKTTTEYPQEVEAQLSAEDLLNMGIESLETAIKGAREILTILKACRKQYKTESKDSKAVQKLQSENVKLKTELADIKAKAATQEATLNKFKALLG